MLFFKNENVEGGRGPSMLEQAVGPKLDQTPEEVWEEGEEHSKPF